LKHPGFTNIPSISCSLSPQSIKTRIETFQEIDLIVEIPLPLSPQSIKTRIETVWDGEIDHEEKISLSPQSIKTRIETSIIPISAHRSGNFKSTVHKNKD